MTKQITQKWDKQQLKRILKSKYAYFIKICLKKNQTKQTETKSLTKVLNVLQKNAYFFNLIWSLEVWLAGLPASEVVIPSLSLEAPSAGMTVEAKSCWKPWEATPTFGTSVALSEDTFWEALVSFVGPCWLGGGGS